MIVYNKLNTGRLGNQLFFVASTIGIALKNNTNYFFTDEIKDIFDFLFKNKLQYTTFIPEKKYHQEQFNYYDIIVNEDIELIGYFQSEKFFKDNEDIIREQFIFNDEIIKYVKEKYPLLSNSCSIHIRRGDYLEQPNHHPTLPLSFYEDFITKNINNYEKFYIFSDDYDWIIDNFKNDKFIFAKFEEHNDLYSFVLMSLCSDNLICNSTYSWWASWLNNNKNKKIYAPNSNSWFGVAYNNLNTIDIIPDKWIII